MRIPSINYRRQTQSLGRRDINAPIRLAQAQSRAAGQSYGAPLNLDPAVQATVTEVANYVDSVTDGQTLMGGRRVTEGMAAWDLEFDQRGDLTPADIPKGVPHSGADLINKNEVRAEMRRAHASDLIQQNAGLIGATGSRGEWIDSMEAANTSEYFRVKKTSMADHKASMFLGQSADIDELINSGRLDTAKVAVRESAGSDRAKSVLNQKIKRAGQTQYMDRALASDNTEDQQRALVMLQDRGNFPSLTYTEMAAYHEKLTRGLSDNLDSQMYQEDKAKRLAVADHRLKAAKGQVTGAEIKAFYNRADNEYYSSSDYLADMKALDSFYTKQDSGDAIMLLLGQSIGQGLDPKTSGGMIKTFMSRSVQQFEQQYPEASAKDRSKMVMATSIESINNWGILPEEGKSILRAANNARSPDQMQAGLEFYRQIKGASGTAAMQLSERGAENIILASSYMDGDMSAAASMALVIEQTQMTADEKASRKLEVEQIMGNDPVTDSRLSEALLDKIENSDRFESVFGGVGGHGVTEDLRVPTIMHVTLQRNFKNFMILSQGNEAASLQAAWDATSSGFQQTNINGEWEIMQNAPVTARVDRIREDMIEAGHPENTVIQSDARTKLEVSKGLPASYQTITMDPRTEGVVFGRYTPDYAKFSSEGAARIEAERQANIAALHQNRLRLEESAGKSRGGGNTGGRGKVPEFVQSLIDTENALDSQERNIMTDASDAEVKPKTRGGSRGRNKPKF